MSQQPDIPTLKLAVPCTTVLQQARWQPDGDLRGDTVTWHERNAPPNASPIVTTHNGQGFFVPGTTTKGDVFDLVGYLDPAISSFEARRAVITGLASPADLERARSAPAPDQTSEAPERASYARLWVTHHPLKEGSPAHTWLTEQRGIHPIVIQAATAQEELREGPHATVWAAHRDSSGRLTGWDAEGPDFKSFATNATRTLFTLDAANGQANRIAIAATPLEALSLATFEQMRGDTIYTAVSGQVGPETAATLRDFVNRIDPGRIDVAIATPTSNAGTALAETIAAVIHDTGIVPNRIFPSHGQKDFNAMIAPHRDAITRAPENDNTGAPQRPEPTPPQSPRSEAPAQPEARSAAPASPSPGEPVTPTAQTPREVPMPPASDIRTIERGQPRAIADNTHISIDVGQSAAGYHYKTMVTHNNRDLPVADWSRPFGSAAEAKDIAVFSAGRDVERAIAARTLSPETQSPGQGGGNAYLMVLAAITKNADGLPESITNNGLKERIADLSVRSQQPGKLETPALQQEIAWAMTDTERATGIKTAVPGPVREEMLAKAVAAPDVQDEHTLRLMKFTPGLKDQETVDAIREIAARMAGKAPGTITLGESMMVGKLEHQVLDENVRQMTQSKTAGQDQTAAADQDQKIQANKQQEQSATAKATQGQKPAVQATNANVRVTPSANAGPGWLDSTAAKFKATFSSNPAAGNGADPAANGTARPAPTQPAPYANTNFDHQKALDDFERHLRVGDVSIAAVNATSALSELQKVMGGISQKIQTAAGDDPGGYASVIAGMKPGGQYEALRTELDAQLLQSQDLAGSFQQAAAAVQNYATKRVDADNWVKANGGNIADLDKDLSASEKDLFAALEKTPGKTSGLDMLSELANRIGNAIIQIVDRARTALGFGAAPGTDPGPTFPSAPQTEQRPGPRPG